MAKKETENMQKLAFQTEAKQMLHLMIHSLYSHKEVFLRELISNASDALDKLRFEALTNKELLQNNEELAVRIKLDKKAKTITITDNGIGMTRQEVIDNIGTIARSGSKAFLEKMTGDQKTDSNLIGQFGVGFYSVFMVASSVKLVTKKAGSEDEAVKWESDGISNFTIGPGDKKDHGTEITVYLKEDESSYAESWNVRSLIKKYSDYIAFPIYLPDDKGKDEVVNETKPLWKRSPSDINEEQYENFYKQSLGGFDKPGAVIHSQAEGVLEYSALLYIPDKAPFDLFNIERKHGVKLYVKRVFIMDDCKELLPDYLRFMKGIVDSEDLPLNVSREILQHNPVVTKIRKNLVNRILDKLKEMAEEEPEKYRSFWKQFGPVVKEGLHTDYENRDKLLELVRFQSSMGETADDIVSLKQYVERMREGQKHIYYLTAENRQIAEKSPHLEALREKSIEVLYMIDPIDEFIVPGIGTYDSKQLKSISKGNLELDDEYEKKKKKSESKFKKLTERIKNILSDQVKEVRISARLKDSPCCLVADENDMGAHMEKIMKAMGQGYTASKPIMEINPEHTVVKAINDIYKNDAKDTDMEEWVRLLFEQAQVAEGQTPEDPLAYSQRVYALLAKVAAEKASVYNKGN